MTNKSNNAPMNNGMIVRAIVLFIALLNQFLVLNGFSPLPFLDQDVEYAATSLLTVGASAWAWWKNNNVRYKARRNDQFLKDKGMK